MKLRWFVSCSAYGRKTEPELYYWNKELLRWEPVPLTEYKEENWSLVKRNQDL